MVKFISPKNYPSTVWAIFTPFHSLVHSNGICIGSATNNQAKYDAMIGFLFSSLDHHILYLHIHLYSLLLFMQLNGVYCVHNHVLFIKYLQVKLLAHEFESITFSHVPIDQNHYVDTIANKILDLHLSHAFNTRQK